uniref:hypothetical protein n=1 Tax=Phocaeicola sp. TaxID=2773926 RepID=UPI003AB24C8A
ELTKVAVSHSHTLQVMGGNTKTNYKATVDYKNTDGIDLRSERYSPIFVLQFLRPIYGIF